MEHNYEYYSQHYGEKYSELVRDYIERKSPVRKITVPLDSLGINKDSQKIIEELIDSQADLNCEHDFFRGIIEGVEHAEELKKDDGTLLKGLEQLNKNL